MPSRLTPPSFEDFTLTFGPYAWLHSSRWQAPEYFWYQSQRRKNWLQIDQAPPVFHRRMKPSAQAKGSWIMQDPTTKKLSAWADLHVLMRTRYKVGFIFYEEVDDLSEETALQALTTLVSSIFLVARLDQVRIVTRGTASKGLLELPKELGLQSQLYTLPLAPWRPSCSILESLVSVDFDRASWMASEPLQKVQQHLKHIRSRLDRFEKADKRQTAPKRKRGLISRIFKPRIDDAIF